MTVLVRKFLLGLLVLLLLVLGTLSVLFGSEAGSRWLLGQVPGLQVEGFSGHLGGRWQAQRLFWQSGEQRLEILSPAFAWRPSCLLRATLCIDQLTLAQADLHLPPAAQEDEPAQPLQLPDLDLPLGLELGEVRIGAVRYNDSEALTRLELAARMGIDGLVLQHLRVQRDDLQAELHGELAPRGDWPLQLAGQLQLPAPNATPWAVELHAQGDLKGRVKLSAGSAGYLQGSLRGWLEPLNEALPAQLQLRVEDFRASTELPPTLRVRQLQLSAEGNLEEGFALTGEGQLAEAQAPVALQLQARLNAAGAQIERLRLLADEQHSVTLKGEADWSDGLSAEAALDWADFPWQRLYPLDTPVQLRRLQAQLSYDDGRYLGNLVSTLDGPAGRFQFASPVSGDLGQLHLPSLRLEAGQGSVEGQLGLSFADGLGWDAQLQVQQFDPSYWLAELPGQLAGPIRSSGRLQGETLSAQAQVQLQGRLRQQPTQLSLDAQGAGSDWQLGNLKLQMGDNRIEGRGRLAEAIDGQLQIALARLDQLWPGLRGALQGNLNVAGRLDAPQGQLSLVGQQLGYTDSRLGQLRLSGALDAAQRGRVQLEADGLRQGELDLGQLRLQGEGDLEQQQASLNLDGPTAEVALALQGALSRESAGWRWNGQLQRGRLAGYGQDWQLQAPARLARLASGRIEFGAHCWLSGEASLCGGEQVLAPQPKLQYRLRDFPLQSLATLLPEDLRWQGRLNADLDLSLADAGPDGQVNVDAGSGVLQMRDADGWVDFPYRTLALQARLRPQRADIDFNFDGDSLGQLAVQAQVDPRGEAKPLNGRFQLRGLQLHTAKAFLPMVEDLQGQLEGDGTLAGSLQSPQVRGQVRLQDGLIGGGDLPTRFEDLQLRADILGQRLQLDGGWRSGEQGRGNIAGSLDWSQGLDLDLRVAGQRLAVDVEPYAQLEVAPDLHLTLAGERLAVSGQVAVPRGAIEVRQLPPSTVKVSPDAQIVGQERPDEGPGLSVAMDVDVIVGREQLTFSGFGLNAEIAGAVHIGDDMDTRGELNLNKGRYRAYGQRLEIRRARMLFAGPISQPFLDVEAVRKVDDVTAGLRLSGSAMAPTTEVFSEPAMGQEQALSYLVLGRPLGGDSGDSNLLAQAALGLGLAGSSGLTSQLAQNLGIDNFQLDTEGSGNATSVVASGNLTDRLSLRYGVGVFEPATTIGLRYELTRRLFLEAASGLASSLDLFYRRDF